MGVDLVFWVAALLGTSLLVISFVVGEIFGGLADLFDGALGGLADALHLDFDATPDVDVGAPHTLNGPVIFAFVTLFGWGGLLARYFGLGALGSSGVGIASGLGAATLIYGFYRYLFSQQSDSSYKIADLIGQAGECTVNIEPGSVGQISVTFKGASRYVTARSAQAIRFGEPVVISKVVGNIVEVSKEGN